MTGKRVLNNNGYSLVELIVSILIMSMIGGIIVMLISSSRNTYNVVNTEAVIQQESEAVRTFVNELAIEAYDCTNSGDPSAYGYAIDCGGGDKCIWILAPDNHQGPTVDYSNYYYFLFLEGSSHCLRYVRISASEIADINDTDNIIALLKGNDSSYKVFGDDYSLLAEHISDIRCKRSGNLITVSVALSFNDQSPLKTMVFNGRNM